VTLQTTAVIVPAEKFATVKPAPAAHRLQPATSISNAHANGSVTQTTNALIQITLADASTTAIAIQ